MATINGTKNDDFITAAAAYCLKGKSQVPLTPTTTGSDMVFAGVGTNGARTSLTSYTLPSNVENLTYTETSSFSGMGNMPCRKIMGVENG